MFSEAKEGFHISVNVFFATDTHRMTQTRELILSYSNLVKPSGEKPLPKFLYFFAAKRPNTSFVCVFLCGSVANNFFPAKRLTFFVCVFLRGPACPTCPVYPMKSLLLLFNRDEIVVALISSGWLK